MPESPEQRFPAFDGIFSLLDRIRQQISPKIEPTKGLNTAMGEPSRGEGTAPRHCPIRDACEPCEFYRGAPGRDAPRQGRCR